MIKNWIRTLFLAIILASCNSFEGPREIDWKKEWKENASKLKNLTREIIANKEGKYKMGNNVFPDGFDYPFDEGFYIGYRHQDTLIDTNRISIRYYVDRGLLDHFSAFIYTKDSTEIKELAFKVQQHAGDYKIEDNWYMVND